MVRLMEGAFAARLKYRAALDALTSGAVPGERRGRSWWVDEKALVAYAEKQRELEAQPAPAA